MTQRALTYEDLKQFLCQPWPRPIRTFYNENMEPFWLCPVCNFLTRRPGICEQCKRKETYSV